MGKDSDYGYLYYDFMCRAYRTREQNSRQGIDRTPMMMLVQNEYGTAIKKQPIDKLLGQLQVYIGKGIEKMLKFKLIEAERAKMLFAQSQLSQAHGSESLVRIIRLAMDATHRLKE